MSKVCAKCGIEKENDQFRKDNKSKDKLGSWCKDCDREYKRAYYAKNREKIRQQYNTRYKTDSKYRLRQQEANKKSRERNITNVREQGKRYRNDLQEFIDNVLKVPCSKCGESRSWLIQFHHIDPNNKKFQIQAGHSKESLEEESKKCICLCANCHTEYHYFYGKKPKQPIESLIEYLGEEVFNGQLGIKNAYINSSN